MDAQRLTRLLDSFVSAPLSALQTAQLLTYLDLLLKWNAKMNLTAVRDAEQIVTRHFGESLFAAEYLSREPYTTAADVGSGAGFPGMPMAIYAPRAQVTLIESQTKKATFLREVMRTLKLNNVTVENARAESIDQRYEAVTMRAVERFEQSGPAASALVQPAGRLALLIGAAQVGAAQKLLPAFKFVVSLPIPLSNGRVLLVGSRLPADER